MGAGHAKGSLKNNFTFSHPIFRPSLSDPQSQSPRNSLAIPVALQFRIEQIRPASGRQFCEVIFVQALRDKRRLEGEEGMAKKKPNGLSPKVIHLDSAGSDYVRILGGPPETVSMRSGLVVLSPGSSVGLHNTENFEEIVVVLEGEGKMLVTGQNSVPIGAGVAVYCPPETEHDVVNTGSDSLRYVYVVAKI